MVALVAHGNVFLSRGGRPPHLTETNSTFQYVGALRFLLAAPSSAASSVSQAQGDSLQGAWALDATDTSDWLQSLKEHDVVRLRLARFQRQGAISGFLEEATLADSGGTASRWLGHWELIADSKPQRWKWGKAPKTRRIWRVTYKGAIADDASPASPELGSARQELAEALQCAVQFAHHARLTSWPELLEGAYGQLQSAVPQYRYHPDMLPVEGYRLEARQLLAAGESAWVFGGMGSWNDFLFDRALLDEYRRATNLLYSAVVNGIVAATNAYDSRAA